MRVLQDRQAEVFVRKLERRGAAGLSKVERRVRGIVDAVRKGGD
jgi:hypothetical protein